VYKLWEQIFSLNKYNFVQFATRELTNACMWQLYAFLVDLKRRLQSLPSPPYLV